MTVKEVATLERESGKNGVTYQSKEVSRRGTKKHNAAA